MGNSYRIKTEVGVDKHITLELDQDFDFLEILSLQISQNDVYSRDCAQYGVVVGRVIANGGLGIPNAKISIFIPVAQEDTVNDQLYSIYPYTNPNDKNIDGYRYNLLPYEAQYVKHAATGTFPTREDVLKDPVAAQLYDKYYKYTVTTNESGDYMIFGIPTGDQVILMDLDLSDIGEFSLTPQDLIRIGRATEAQVGGDRFNSSVDIDTLPQIVSLQKVIQVSPFWGDPNQCLAAINRVDFDLRQEANIEIEPTAVFIGSMISTIDKFRVAAPFFGTSGPPGMIQSACKPKDNLGNLCDLTSGPGQILSVRQTIYQDDEGRPVLEEYRLPNSGNVIDQDGTWVTELPMNLNYVVTAEDGTRIFSNDPSVGIPTKAKYRFKIKWAQSPQATEKVRRPYYLVPNVKEYGWRGINDPVYSTTTESELQSSYYFGLDWSGYTGDKTVPTIIQNQKLSNAINCEDTFYEFDYNKVYTISSLIDQYKRGTNRARFIGIKEIDDDDCSTTVNKFPVNEGFKNFDAIYFLFAILMQIFQLSGSILIVIWNILGALWNAFSGVLAPFVIAFLFYLSVTFFIGAGAAFPAIGLMILNAAVGAALLILGIRAIQNYQDFKAKRFGPIRLPMITYPGCTACDCKPGDVSDDNGAVPTSLLSQFSNNGLYFEKINNLSLPYQTGDDGELSEANKSVVSLTFSQAMGTRVEKVDKIFQFKSTESEVSRLPDDKYEVLGAKLVPRKFFAYSTSIPMGARINTFNGRKKYFDNINKMSVSFNYTGNTNVNHFDNTLTIVTSASFETGTLLTFVSPQQTKDVNYLYTGETVDGAYITGISGETLFPTAGPMTINYATGQFTNGSVTYYLNTGSTEVNYKYPLDIEYYQVVTAITVADAFNLTPSFGCNTCQEYEVSTPIGQTSSSFTSTVNYIDCDNNPQTLILGPTVDDGFGVFDPIIETICACQPPTIDVGDVTVLGACQPPTNYDGFVGLLDSSTIVKYNARTLTGWPGNNDGSNLPTQTLKTRDVFADFEQQYVLILQRGVDPYSPKYVNKYGIGKILGFPNENDVVVTGETRLNVPIQALPNSTNISVQKHQNQSDIFIPSQFFRAGNDFTAFTTSNVGYYSALDKNTNFNNFKFGQTLNDDFGFVQGYFDRPTLSGVQSLTSNNVNNSYSSTPNWARYDNSEDLSGVDYYFTISSDSPNGTSSLYLSFSLLPALSASPMNIISKNYNVMRTDRLPTSDFLNGYDWQSVVPVLQQNNGFALYVLNTDTEDFTTEDFSTGFETVEPDIEDLPASTNVLESFDCANMVSLKCYENQGTNFGINPDCPATDVVERGCYVIMPDGPKINGPAIKKDLLAFKEWGLRFRFFYALCRGVLSQTFTNNWVNGTLFTVPIQTRPIYGSDNTLSEILYCKEFAYYDESSSNFYMRSSPYNPLTNKFVGKIPSPLNETGAVNVRNLLYPTTVINLGPKDIIYSELSLEPSMKGYVINQLTPTSYGDTTDLVNLFVVSRISNSEYLNKLLTIANPNGVVNQLFSREERRVDGDLAQLMSINSEFGVVKFSPDAYDSTGNTSTSEIQIIGVPGANSVMAVFFSSTTEDLQFKDFITPGRINFRPNPTASAYPYVYGIKSQTVPFYQWRTKTLGGSNTIFGGQNNEWATSGGDIFSDRYQSLSRTNPVSPTYFLGSNALTNDLYARGYIYNVDNNGNLSLTAGNYPRTFLVGAPNHFYFGLINGASALDKFKQKYLGDE